MENVIGKLQRIACLVLLMMTAGLTAMAQNEMTVRGSVTDEASEPVIGATVVVTNRPNVGTITDFDGNFTLAGVRNGEKLTFTYVGMASQVIKASSRMNIVMKSDQEVLNEVVVVGYGQQKKASVVGAITQTTGKVLERSGGITDVGAALTGNLPGVVTTSSSGLPGEEDPQIVIRGASSWNSSAPLVLVDGIERPMKSVDISSVATISVLKDASATAVYGVKGANGVILITTKRGEDGKARINATVNMVMKVPSKLPNKLDSYDAFRARNTAIEHELSIKPDSWDFIKSQDFIDNYRNQTSVEQRERYPNVDWQDALFKKSTMSYNANLNVSGGSSFVKYFASVDFVNEGDLFKVYPNNRGYDSGYGYDRINVRSNLDFQISKTTVLKMNIAGSSSAQKTPYNNSQYSSTSDWSIAQQWAGAYNIAPDVFLPVYSDGSWGFYPSGTNVSNSASNISLGGTMKTTTTTINTDFSLDQQLDFITPGLKFHGMISWDNQFVEWKRGVNDLFNDAQQKWINPVTGDVTYKQAYDSANKFDFQQPVSWAIEPGEVRNDRTRRNLNYQMQLFWGRTFGNHDLTAMGLFSRQQTAFGSMIPNYREDWVFRLTYNFAQKYFLEYNGAYNGSEKFSKDNRFAFFNSAALGWMVTEEKFMKNLKWLDMFKLRASYGEIGDDNVPSRWLYMDQWAFMDEKSTSLDVSHGTSPYYWYREASVGNPDVHWETVTKWNYGADYSLFHGLLIGSVDIFRDHRTNILVGGSDRAVPSYYGQAPATANLGEVKTKGFEITLRINKVLANKMRLWADLNMTHAENKIIIKDDQPLLPAYRKQAGFAIGQNRAYLDGGYLRSYDDIYGSPKFDTNNDQKLPGDYYIVDFNGDGVVDVNDQVPYGYAESPQNTYNATLGFDWKGFSCFVQFYGVSNVTRDVTLTDFGGQLNTVYDQGQWWSKYADGDVPPSRWLSTPATYSRGTRYLYDGSYIRLKNVELAYNFTEKWVKNLGVDNLRLYINANNLWVWSRMPDDRESNFAGWGSQGAYPTVKRINFGIRVGF